MPRFASRSRTAACKPLSDEEARNYRAMTRARNGRLVRWHAPPKLVAVRATLKAWIDLVCRAGVTFRYTKNGPEGLLANRPVDIVITSGGVPLGSPVDFVTGYLKQVFAFIGIDDVNIVGAAQMNVDADASLSAARAQIERIETCSERREVA